MPLDDGRGHVRACIARYFTRNFSRGFLCVCSPTTKSAAAGDSGDMQSSVPGDGGDHWIVLSLTGVLRRVRELRRHRERSEWSGDEELVFPSLVGTPLSHSNVLSRVLRPIAEEAGAPWAGFHAFRHTCASMLFERGANAKQVQKWLGHHSAAFTLSKYIHLLGDELGEPLAIDTELAGATVGATSVTELTRGAGAPAEADSAQEAEFAIQHKPAQAAALGS